MKINTKNTALNFLDDGDKLKFSTEERNLETAQALEFMYYEFPKMRPLFRKKIQYISEPFVNAYKNGRERLRDIITNEPFQQSGTFIWPAPGGSNTIFYELISEGTGENWKLTGTVIYLYKKKDLAEPYLFCLGHIRKEGGLVYLPESAREHGFNIQDLVADPFYLLVFLKYCELETKIIPGGRKDVHVKQKYVNETNSPVEILDSTWFTTIVKSEGFKVGDETGGFWRWQHYGPGFTQKRLQWIFPFEKEGYTRKAKILKDKE